jgi:hypothetical protein
MIFVPAFGEWSTEDTLFFCREAAGGILVSPILHQRRLPDRQSIDDGS